jgi:predicted ATPase/DNA-binding CsgD family transcriptional regulator
METGSQGPASPREAEVLAMLGTHMSNAEIAGRLHISVRTVEAHVSSLLRKYGAIDRRALAAIAQDVVPTTELASKAEPAASPPAWHTTVVGRSHERDTVLAMLEAARLVTLTGPGGVGKTRLAVVIAAAAAPSFPLGSAFADLVPARDELVIQAVATALGVTERPGEPLDRAVLRRLSRGRRLLILDNCEHVLDAAAGFADRVLASGPGTTILVTSRERLGVPGERVVPISPMPLASDAEALSADRALAADPEFEAVPAIIAEICSRLDGVPLAIELAAARCASLGAIGLLTALDDIPRLLAAGRDRDQRHRSLRAVIGWSYELLSDEERALFRRLAVFAGSFDIAAAAAVTAGASRGEIADLLGRLADKSLVARDGAEGRWRLLDTVRAFAADQLAAGGELRDTQDRYLRWAADTAAALLERLGGQRTGGQRTDGQRTDGQPPGAQWRADFDAVAGDLRAALSHCPPGPAALPHQLTRTMGYLTYARRFLTEALDHFQDAARRAPEPLEAAADLRTAAQAVFATGLAGRAFDLHLAAAERAQGAGDGNVRAIALADAVVTAGRFTSGFAVCVPLERLHDLLAEAEAAADPRAPAVAPRLAAARAAIAAACGTPTDTSQPTARDSAIAEQAVGAARAAGDPVLVSGSLDALGVLSAQAGWFRQAHETTRERLALLRLMDRNHPYAAAEILAALHDAWLGALAVGNLPETLAIAQRFYDDDLLGAHPYRPASKMIPPLVLMGRFDEALCQADAMWAAWQRSGTPIAVWLAPAASATALALGLLGDDAGLRLWRARAQQATGTGNTPLARQNALFATFADLRVAVQTGATGEPADLVADAFAPSAHGWNQAYAQAAAAELAAAAGLPDAAVRLDAAATAAEQNDWACACVARADGRLHHDTAKLSESAERWQRIGARFERACTLRLLGQRPGPGAAAQAIRHRPAG